MMTECKLVWVNCQILVKHVFVPQGFTSGR